MQFSTWSRSSGYMTTTLYFSTGPRQPLHISSWSTSTKLHSSTGWRWPCCRWMVLNAHGHCWCLLLLRFSSCPIWVCYHLISYKFKKQDRSKTCFKIAMKNWFASPHIERFTTEGGWGNMESLKKVRARL